MLIACLLLLCWSRSGLQW